VAAIDKAADVIGGLPADHIRSFMQGRAVIAHDHVIAFNRFRSDRE
jgi:hypothetical protein